MEHKEKIKFLYKGKKVKLKPLDEVDRMEPPTVTREMEKRFGSFVTIERILNMDMMWETGIKVFTIEEEVPVAKLDEDKFRYNPAWIETVYFVPNELFEI